MPDDGDYELLPHEELEQLRKEVAKLQKNPLGKGKAATDLIDAVNELKTAIASLTVLFTKTNDEMLHEFRRTSLPDHFKKITKQNEDIAQGIISVAQMIQSQQPIPSPPEASAPEMSPSTQVQAAPSAIVDNSMPASPTGEPQTQVQPAPGVDAFATTPDQGMQMPPTDFSSQSPPAMPLPPPPKKKKGLF